MGTWIPLCVNFIQNYKLTGALLLMWVLGACNTMSRHLDVLTVRAARGVTVAGGFQGGIPVTGT